MEIAIGSISIVISIIVLLYAKHMINYAHKYNYKIDIQNKQLEEKNKALQESNDNLLQESEKIKENYTYLVSNVNLQKQRLDDLYKNAEQTVENQKQLSQKAFENFCEVLERDYDEKEEEYNAYKNALETSYFNRQLELMEKIDEVQKDLDKIKATRAAAIQAQTREKEIEEKLAFYCLSVSEMDLKDIGVLETVAPKLSNPRTLYMLIWQTYFRTPMTNLCNNVIGTSVKTGIYKITNIKTKECYIGQAVDIASRWKEHAKCGLRIDTPAGNKLYKAMQEYGIWNFSWEVLEEVPSAQLNEKEKYYIDLYDAYNYGYNKNKGVN